MNFTNLVDQYPQITVACELITPEKARELLKGNYGNRPLRRTLVERLAQEMMTGNWQISHQGIAIAPDGRLLDGQHRLAAIVRSGVTVPMMVARNVPHEAFKVIDRGAKRSLVDVTRQDSRIVSACAFIARLYGHQHLSAAIIERFIDVCGEEIMELLAAAGSTPPVRGSAPIRAAAALRIHQGHKDYVLNQWRALINLEFQEMTPAMQALCRQLTDGVNPAFSRRAIDYDRAARAWLAFDPKRSGMVKLIVRDVGSVIDEMRAVLRLDEGT